MKHFFIFIALFSIFSTGFAQTQLNLLDGRQIKLDSYVFHTHEGYMNYSTIKNNGKIKNSFSDLDDVYSISINGKDSVIYEQLIEEEFSVDEMSRIVIGRQFAKQEYNPWWAFAAGMVVGSGPLLLPINGGMAIWLLPVAYTAGMAFVRPSKSYVIERHDYAVNDDLLVYGYRSTGRKKVLKNTALGVLGGVFASGIVLATLHYAGGQ